MNRIPAAQTSGPAAATLASFCAQLDWQRMSQPARERSAELVLDLLGVAVRGSSAASSRPVQDMVREQPAGVATVLGTDLRSTAPWAALANGAAAHATEMDDVTTESSLHPGTVVIPTAIALSEERGASGAAFLTAVVAGYEVMIRIGNALGAASAYARGFHPTGVAGVFGAAVASGKLLGLDADGLTRAIGIAGTLASGSLEYLADGSWTKRLNPAWAAHAGIVAATLARAGFTGPATALEGAHGFLRGYSDAADPTRLSEELGERELEVMRVSIKPYGCCRYNHGIIDAVLALRREHGLRSEDVAELRLGVLSGGWALVAEPQARVRAPRNVVDAQFSAPYAAAVALSRGRAGLAEFSDTTLADPEIRALAGRASCYRDASLDAEYPKAWPAAVEVRLNDGRILTKRIERALGEPENPVPRDALVDRFVEMVVERVDSSRARELAERVLGLGDATDLDLMRELAARRSTPR